MDHASLRVNSDRICHILLHGPPRLLLLEDYSRMLRGGALTVLCAPPHVRYTHPF